MNLSFPGHAFRRMMEAFPLPWRLAKRAEPALDRATSAGYGCCPACQQFIRFEPRRPGGQAVCPSCGRLIRSVDPLGSARSLGATDEL
jgi:hypothetical protein